MDLLEMGIMDMDYNEVQVEVQVGVAEEVEGRPPCTAIQRQL